jgi:retinoblastoma-like protein 1
VDFFKEMPQFCLKVAHVLTGLYGSDWEKRLEVYYAISMLPLF